MSDDLSVTQDTDVAIAPASTDIVVVADYEVEVIQTFEQGPPGPQGPQGPLGPIGPAGPEGPHGNTIHYDARDPLPGDGLPGDSWINTATNMLFGPKSLAGTWPAGISLIGPQGIQGPQGIIGPQGPQGIQGIQGIPGNTVLYGTVNPVAGTGVDGNFYINTTTHFMFGPKALGAWPAGTSLVGPQGAQGIQGPPGAVPEAPTDGQTYGRRGSDTSWQLITITGTVRYDTVQALTVAQQQQARQNIYAAPFDAMAFSGFQINGNMEIAQELGANFVTLTNQAKYVCDVWSANVAMGATQFTSAQVLGVTCPGFPAALRLTTGGATAPGVNDYVIISQFYEGTRWNKLKWGSAAAQPLTIGFWIFTDGAAMPQTGSVNIRNQARTRSYCAEFTVTASSVWQYKTVTIPGCPDGVWEVVNSIAAAEINIAFAAGTSVRIAPNAWTNSTAFASTGVTNFYSAANYGVYITGFTILPGLQVPDVDRYPLVTRRHDQEFPNVQRWFRLFPWTMEGHSGGAQARITTPHQFPAMRQPPTVTRVSIGSITNIRNNDSNTFVTCSANAEGEATTSMESAAAGYTQAVNVLDKMTTRF
jgi:hypothetical protein